MLSKSLSTSQKFARLNEVAGKLAEFCQTLYPLINSHADDFGRLQGDAFTVKHVCHPTSPRRVQEFALALQYLDDVGLIRWYEVDGAAYIQILKFEDHQTGLNKRTRSRFPEPPGATQDIPGVSKKILPEEKRTEQKGTEQKDQTLPALFARFWEAYPRHEKRHKAEAAFRKLKPDEALVAKMLAALEWQRNQPTWLKDHGEYIPHPTSWLNQRRWEDEPFHPPHEAVRGPVTPGVEDTRQMLEETFGGR